MTINEEITALIHYVETKNPGSVIRDIIKLRIELLSERGEAIEKINAKSIQVQYKDIIYPSISQAALHLNIALTTLKDDIKRKSFNYKVYPV